MIKKSTLMVFLGGNKELLETESDNFLTRSIKCVNHDKYLLSANNY